jgi:7,8-dihydropterin-6-yl-methyl-4-(beta-D-ribofuranosyl)aminobenzene 5'-phosphate synthase
MDETTRLQVRILRDDECHTPGLRAGHGISMLVQTPETTFLLDTGDSPEVWQNADTMGIDVSEVQCVVLSHGHYDHTGGLEELLKIVGGLPVIAHPGVFEAHWAIDPDGSKRYVGTQKTQAEYEALGAQFELSREAVPVGPGLLTSGEVPRRARPTAKQETLMVERDGELELDDFEDDLSVIVQLPQGTVILTGCAHAGLRNIARQCVRASGCENLRAIVGGTHLYASDEAEVREVARQLHMIAVDQIVPLHCTGAEGKKLLVKYFDGETLLAGTGDTVVCGSDVVLSVHSMAATAEESQ